MSFSSQRLDFLYLSLVGHVVVVYTVDGEATEGLFASCTEDGSSIQLTQTRNRCSQLSGPTTDSDTHAVMRISMDNVVWMDAPCVRLEAAAAGQVERFQGQPMERMDWASMPMDDEHDNFEEEAKNHKQGSFNQFEVNQQKFGVKSTYSEEQYTTKLKKGTAAEEAYANRIAAEIEGSSTRGIQHRIDRGEDIDLDEGDLYSNVARNPQPERPPKKGAQNPPTNSTQANNSSNNNNSGQNKNNASNSSPTSAAPSRQGTAAPASGGHKALSVNAQAWVAPADNIVQALLNKVGTGVHTPSPPMWGSREDAYGNDDAQQQTTSHQHHHQPPHNLHHTMHHHHHHHHHHQINHHMHQHQHQQQRYDPVQGVEPYRGAMPTLAPQQEPQRGAMGGRGGMGSGPRQPAGQPQQPVSSVPPTTPAPGRTLTRGGTRATGQSRTEESAPPTRGGKR